MFETAVIPHHPGVARARFSMLTISLVAHSALITGAVILSVASVEFPVWTPPESARAPVVTPIQIPPPLGRPDGGSPPRQPEPANKPPVDRPVQQLAPLWTTSEAIQPIAGVDAGGTVSDDESSGGGDRGALGVPWGVDGGMGDLDAPPVATTPVESRIYEAAEVNAPVLMHRVEPVYPAMMIRTRVPATVVVRCVIDRHGHVRDPEIVSGAMAPFNDAVLEAVVKWRFHPGSLRGQAVDTWLNLTVNFSVKGR